MFSVHKLTKPSHDLYAWGTILCNVKRIDNILNMSRRGDVTFLKPENFLVPTAHQKHPVRTRQSRPRSNSRYSQLFTPPPPREKRENNFYCSHLRGDCQTSGVVLGPGHVSQGGLRRGRRGQIAGSQASTPPFLLSPTPCPTRPRRGLGRPPRRATPRPLHGGELVVM